MDTQEQRIERERTIFEINVWLNTADYESEDDVVLKIMHALRGEKTDLVISPALQSAERYADLRCKPLVEALELAYNYLQSGISVNPHSGIHNTIEKALQDYKK